MNIIHLSVVFWFGAASTFGGSGNTTTKFDLILERLKLREHVKGEAKTMKMHTGNNLGFSTVHPVFVRKGVQAVKEGGGKVFVRRRHQLGRARRGRTRLQFGNNRLPGVPHGRPDEKYFYSHHRPYKNIQKYQSGPYDSRRLVSDQSHTLQRPSVVQFRRNLQESGVGDTGQTRGAWPCWCYRCWLGIIRKFESLPMGIRWIKRLNLTASLRSRSRCYLTRRGGNWRPFRRGPRTSNARVM